jgi:trehalose 6-phosphate synthase/phosphatase
MGRILIVSNRLPVRISREDDDLYYLPSEGGVATGLSSIHQDGNNLWIGWPGHQPARARERSDIERGLREEKMVPVFLSAQLVRDFYEGFSNETIWPLFHYFSQYATFDERLFTAYIRANQRYCTAVLAEARQDDVIWIHDYHLMLLPRMIREKLPTISIGFFLHVPFPSYEVFRTLPWRKEVLMGLLGADLVGVHTYDDMRHFLSSVSRLAGIPNNRGRIETGNRIVEVDAFPMGIDYQRYALSAAAPKTLDEEIRFRNSLGEQKLILSIDRLDYSKGIPQRLKAFERFLQKYPEFRQRVSLILIVVPSRDTVGRYRRLKEEVDLLAGRINGTHGRLNWTPVHYFYRSFPLESLSAFYRMADVALVTPFRDGMNLICKEYIASKLEKTGVLILSEMAGASKELSDAILINPNDIDSIVEALRKALLMPEEEQIIHMTLMQQSLKHYNIRHWVNLYMKRLSEVKDRQLALATKNVDGPVFESIQKAYRKAKKRIFFLDYDGTLTGFKNDPLQAGPDPALIQILQRLGSAEQTRVVIISGRDRSSLDRWLGNLPVDIIAEHGVWLKSGDRAWRVYGQFESKWKDEIRPVLQLYVDRTPGSFIEEKDYSMVWHFRKVETGLGRLRSGELSSHLKYLVANKNLQVLEGDMIVEVKNTEVNKGMAAHRWLNEYRYDFVAALGDDWTDEDTFRAMPKKAITIKVGSTASSAKYHIASFREVRSFLRSIIQQTV